MNKPLTLVYENFKKEMEDLINNSNLPFFIIANVLQDFLNQSYNLAKKQYELDKGKYEKSLLEESSKEPKEKQD